MIVRSLESEFRLTTGENILFGDYTFLEHIVAVASFPAAISKHELAGRQS